MYTITRYSRRNWAVYCDGKLLAVTVYRKGARAVVAKLESMWSSEKHALRSYDTTVAA